jgi:hypothetical protein
MVAPCSHNADDIVDGIVKALEAPPREGWRMLAMLHWCIVKAIIQEQDARLVLGYISRIETNPLLLAGVYAIGEELVKRVDHCVNYAPDYNYLLYKRVDFMRYF